MTTHTDKKEECTQCKLEGNTGTCDRIDCVKHVSNPSQEMKQLVRDAFSSPSKNETPEAPLQEEGVEDWEKVFDRGFVWSLASDNCYALFRTMSDKEVEQNPAVSGTITIAKPEYVKAFIRQALATQKEQTVRATREEVLRDLFKTRIIPKKVEDQEASFLIQLTVKQTIKKYAQKVGISLDTQE